MNVTPAVGSIIVAPLMAVALCTPAVAQDSDGWTGQVTPYVWAASLGGDITPFNGAPTVRIERSFSELLEDSDGAFFLSGYARWNRLVFLGDFSHSTSSKGGLAPPGIPAKGELSQTSLTLAGGYRAVHRKRIAIDALAGARIWSVEGSVVAPVIGIAASPDLRFADPIVAGRANLSLATRWSVIAYADVGGLRAGSELTSQIVATINFQVFERLFLSAGYRALSVDYDEMGSRIDATMAGPLLGVTWRFRPLRRGNEPGTFGG